jgi:hypothetical protein
VSKSRIPAAMAAATVAFPCASSAACSPRFECTNAQPIIRSLTDSGVPVARSSAGGSATISSAQGAACRWPAIERSIPAAVGAVGWGETAEDPLAAERKEKQLPTGSGNDVRLPTFNLILFSLFPSTPSTVDSDTEPSQLRRALPSVEHFVFCHPDSSLLNTAVFCRFVYIYHFPREGPAIAAPHCLAVLAARSHQRHAAALAHAARASSRACHGPAH